MSDEHDDQDLTTTDEQQEDPKPVRGKSPRASGRRNKANAGKDSTQERTRRDGKPVRKTASGFTVVG